MPIGVADAPRSLRRWDGRRFSEPLGPKEPRFLRALGALTNPVTVWHVVECSLGKPYGPAQGGFRLAHLIMGGNIGVITR